VRWVSLINTEGKGLTAFAQPDFSFSAHHYSLDCLTQAKHTIDLKDSGEITLNLDYAMRGLGSASCGPTPEEPYELKPHAFNFSVYLCSCNSHNAMRKSQKLPQALFEMPNEDETYKKYSVGKNDQQGQKRKGLFDCD
jgi:hypothetical protein